MAEQNQYTKKRARDESGEPELDSPEVKRIKDDLLGLLDDGDTAAPSPDLDFVMRSFAEEISTSSSGSPVAMPPPAAVEELAGESQPELGYLLEASDDELGLPPSTALSEEPDSVQESLDSAGIGEIWGFGDEIPSFDSLEFGTGESNGDGIGNGEYVALDGLFDYSDAGFGPSDLLWRPEMPAL